MVNEYEEVLARADDLAAKLKISRQEALLLITAHEAVCIHFHIDAVLASLGTKT